MDEDIERRNGRRSGIGTVALPIVATALPTAAFQMPNLVSAPGVRSGLVVVALVVFAGVVVAQVLRARRAEAARVDAEDRSTQTDRANEIAVQYAFGQVATRLARFASVDATERRFRLGALADRVSAALAFYSLPHVPDVRANAYLLAPDQDRLEPIGHGGAGDTAGTFRAGTPIGDRTLAWVVRGGPPQVVRDRLSDDDVGLDPPDAVPRYRSCVAVVVRSDDYSFGMVTVDSPEPDAFSGRDVENVVVMAAYLAVACALTHPPRSARHETRN